VEQAFNEALDAAIPTLDEMFTDVYRRLTQQVSYDLVRTYRDPEKTGALELRVASRRLPDSDHRVDRRLSPSHECDGCTLAGGILVSSPRQ
jgi:hypothetical protein